MSEGLIYKGLGFGELVAKDVSDASGEFTGVASTSDRDLHGDILEPGCFGNSIDPEGVTLLRDHDKSQIIGGWKEFRQDGNKLHVRGEIDLLPELPVALATYALMKRGRLKGISVGFRVEDPEKHIKFEGKTRRFLKARLVECSIVGSPANPHARVRNVKSLERPEFCSWLKEYGFEDNEVEVVMTKGFDALRDGGRFKFDADTFKRLLIQSIDGFERQDPLLRALNNIKALRQDLTKGI